MGRGEFQIHKTDIACSHRNVVSGVVREEISNCTNSDRKLLRGEAPTPEMFTPLLCKPPLLDLKLVKQALEDPLKLATFGVVFNKSWRIGYCWFLSARAHCFRGLFLMGWMELSPELILLAPKDRA